MSAPRELRETLQRVRLLVADVDGVLTDGTLHYGDGGEAIKAFHVRDGMGLRLLMQRGIDVAVITARTSEALTRRMADLKVRHFYPGRDDKWTALQELLRDVNVPAQDVAFVGDDVLDLPAMRRVGLAITVSDGHADVQKQADWITAAGGGKGAVREIADEILASRGRADSSFDIIIPTRYAATRLPGKPLRELAGRPLVAHVWDRAIESGASEVIVATDDDRIRAAVEEFGGRTVMTSPDCASGTDRLAQVVSQLGWADDRIVVNLQGDEPLIDGELMRSVAQALVAHPRAGISTLATPIGNARDLFNVNVVKVVLDDRHMARYFSRAPIPWARDAFARSRDELPPTVAYLRHVGLYGYRVDALKRLAAEAPRPAERAESLEQLRALALGIDIHVSIVEKAPGHGVDTEADLARVEQLLRDRVAQ